MSTLLDLVPNARKKGPNEYHAPCPWCGGKDRFVIWTQESHQPAINAPIGRYFCRQCGRTGDAIDFLRQTEGLSFPEACERLHITTNQYLAEWRTDQPSEPQNPDVDLELAAFRAWLFAPLEDILHGLESAFIHHDRQLWSHLRYVLRERHKVLLYIAQRYNERHGRQLDAFIKTETGKHLQDMFRDIGLRPLPKTDELTRLKVYRPIKEPADYELL